MSKDDASLIAASPKLLKALMQARSDIKVKFGNFVYRENFSYIDKAIDEAFFGDAKCG